MGIFDRFRKKEQVDYQLTNEDWQIVAQMLFRYVNRDQNINTIVNKTDYITKAFAYNGTVYSVVNMRAVAAKGIPWLVYRITNKQKHRQYVHMTKKDWDIHRTIQLKEQSMEEVESGPINNLLKKPNPTGSFSDLVEGMFIYRDVTGDAYLYKVANPIDKKIIQLHLLPADKVKIVGGTFLNPIAGYRLDGVFDKPLEPEKVMHWKYFNPIWDSDGRQLYGMSPLVPAARTINSDNAGISNETASFANEGVKGIITGTDKSFSDVEFTKEQADTLIKKMSKAVARAKSGGGNVMFNRTPLQMVKIGETPVDLGVLDSRKYNKEVLSNIFRIHPSMLSSDASTLNNLREGRKALMTMSVMPDMDSLRDNLNSMLQASFGEEFYIDYDIMAISELQDDIKTLSETLKGMDWITRNEKRTVTMYEPYPDQAADILYGTMAEIPLGFGMDSSFTRIDEEIQKLRK